MMRNNLLKWLKLTAGIIILPIVLVAGSALHISALKQAILLEEFETQAADYRERIRAAAATEKYLCRSLRHIFDTSPTMETLETELKDFLATHNIAAEYALWQHNSVYSSNFDYAARPGDWNSVMKQMRRFSRRDFHEETDIPEKIYRNLRTIFGLHFFPRYYYFSRYEALFRLSRTDSAGNRPLLWIDANSDICMAVFIDAEVLETYCGAEYFVKHLTPDDLQIAVITDEQITASSKLLTDLLQHNREKLHAIVAGVKEIDGFWVTTGLIDDSITAVISKRIPRLIDKLDNRALLAISACFALLALGFMSLSFYVVVLGKHAYIPLRFQILLLFMISTLLPGTILYTLATDYLQHYQKGLTTTLYNDGLLYLQQIDELFSSEYSLQKNLLESAQPELIENLRHRPPDRKTIMSFLRSQNTRPAMFYLVASSSELVATDIGIVQNGRVTHEFGRTKLKGNAHRLNMARGMLSLNRYILAKVNNQPISEKLGIEMEEISSILLQREPAEVLKEFFEGGHFWIWGIAYNQLPTYVNYIEVFTPGIVDYLLTFIFETVLIEKAYVKRIYHSINRNELGMRVVAFSNSFHDVYPSEAADDKTLMDFARKVWQRNLTAPEFAVVDGQAHMLIGHNGQKMDRFALLGAVSMAPIAEKTRQKRNMFLMFVALALTITFSLGLNVANAFLSPLAELKEGVKAMNERNFSYRLPVHGSDEFTTLARLFNGALIDLEEMTVASQVQQKLVSTTEEPELCGNMSIYCNSHSKSTFSNTFIDLLDLEDGKKIAVMKDIEEAGVASCLVLAFMKAAILQLPHLYRNPQQLLTELKQLFTTSNRSDKPTSLKTIVALIDQNGEIQIANSGLPTPILVNTKTMEVSELNSTRSDNNQTACSLKLAENETILCLSNDLIDSARLRTILTTENCCDPAKLYAAICTKSESTAPPTTISHPGTIIITNTKT